MDVIMAIIVGALIVGLLWTISYFNGEIYKLKEKRSVYSGGTETPSYATYMARKERDEYRKEAEEWRNKYFKLQEHCSTVLPPDEMRQVYELEEEEDG